MREVLVNGRFLVQRATGVQRVSREFTLAADRLLAAGAFPTIRLRLVAPIGADFAGLGLKAIATEHVRGGSGYRGEQIALARRAGRQPLISLGNAAPVVSLLRGGPVAVMIHDQSYRLFPADYSRAYRWVHAVMDRVILARARPLFTVSQTEAAAIRAGNPGMTTPIVVAANGSWAGDDLPPPSPPAGRASFGLSIGGFADRKNFDGVFAVAVALARRGIGFRFVGQPTERARAMLAEAGDDARAHIRYLGYLTNDALVALYREAGFLLYPSFYEASGLPPSEAMTFGCPVIASDLPVMRERCGDAVLYCDPRDPAAIAAAAMRLIDDPALAADLSWRGEERAGSFTWRRQAEIILSAVEASA